MESLMKSDSAETLWQILVMKSAFKGVTFWIGQKDVEVQLSVNKALQFRQKCEEMQAAYSQKMSQVEEAYTSKLQQAHAGYQKAMKKIQAMENEKEAMQKDKKEIQEKYTEKSRFLTSTPWTFLWSTSVLTFPSL